MSDAQTYQDVLLAHANVKDARWEIDHGSPDMVRLLLARAEPRLRAALDALRSTTAAREGTPCNCGAVVGICACARGPREVIQAAREGTEPTEGSTDA